MSAGRVPSTFYRIPSTVCHLLMRRDVMNLLRLNLEIQHWPLAASILILISFGGVYL